MPELENSGGGRGKGGQEQDSLFQPEHDGGICARSGNYHPPLLNSRLSSRHCSLTVSSTRTTTIIYYD